MWQRKYAGAALAWMGFIWLLSDQPHLTSGLDHDYWWRKLVHVFEFAVLAWLWARAIGGAAGKSMVFAALIALVYAGLDEWHQTLVAGRHGTPRDVLIDAMGIGIAAAWLLRRRRLSC